MNLACVRKNRWYNCVEVIRRYMFLEMYDVAEVYSKTLYIHIYYHYERTFLYSWLCWYYLQIFQKFIKAALEFAANCLSHCTEVKASPEEALTESTKEVAPAKIDLQAVLLITHDACSLNLTAHSSHTALHLRVCKLHFMLLIWLNIKSIASRNSRNKGKNMFLFLFVSYLSVFSHTTNTNTNKNQITSYSSIHNKPSV